MKRLVINRTRRPYVSLLLAAAGLLLCEAACLHAQDAPAPAVVQPPPAPPADDVWKFDFGGPASPVAAGWYAVRPDTEYTPELKFGLVKAKAVRKPFDLNRRVYRDTLILDDVTRDGILGLGPFRVDLANGKYHVAVLTGEFTRDGTNRPPCHTKPYKVMAGQTVLYEQAGTLDEFYGPTGRYFASYKHDWHPDMNPYRTYVARFIPFGEADIEVTDGALTISVAEYDVPVNALFVYPVGRAAGEQALKDFRLSQETVFNKQFPYLPDAPEHPMPTLPPEVTAAGAVMYVRDDAAQVRPGMRPVPRDLGRALRLCAAQGEREAGVVAVTPLRDVRGQVTLQASDLVGENGAKIASSAFDIRYLKYTEDPVDGGGYQVRPFFLVPWQPDRWEKELTRGFWVDLFTPADAAPGLYEGKLTLTGPDGLNAALPVQVRVLPLQLPMCRLRAGVYASGVGSTTLRAFTWTKPAGYQELAKKVLHNRIQFLADQGFTGLFDSLHWGPIKLKKETGEYEVTDVWQTWKDFFELAQTFPNFKDRVYCYYMAGPQLYPYTCPHWLDVHDIKKLEMDQITFSDEAVAEMTRATQWLYGQLRGANYPELVFYVQDELGNHGAKGARYGRELLKALNKVKAQVPGGFQTCISTLGIADAREYMSLLDITIPNSGFPITDETLAEIRTSGSILGLYNIGSSRFTYGFYPWRVGAVLRAQWSFTYDGDVSDPYTALPTGARVSCDCKYTPDWDVLPSIGMLVQREGVDDYRYIQLLEERIAAAEKAGRGAEAAVTEGKAVLQEIRDAVKETLLDPANNWDASTMNYHRWNVAQAAIRLEAVGK
ncbi:MAG: hypothetical protein A3K19_05625 [Lentisphaerae bacterium RIFOXYB12_FULL_65_16]|nr:MAG: hypothetical protein A3K18_23665 [Lentisphaerae bacterium RIFOXYA12_64_32]OGV94389.1 MAG: hypothetical protein A3K19_05625 [Lentisphaerae bacterium RIFOXYB12_FULL_65_16]